MSNCEQMKKNTVLIVSPAKPAKGGIASYVEDLLISGLRDEYDLRLFDCHALKNRSKKRASHVDIKEIYNGLKVLKHFVRHLRDCSPALVHIHTSSYWGFYEKALLLFIAKYFFRKKTILHIHGGGFDGFYESSRARWLIRWLIGNADKVLFVSRKTMMNAQYCRGIHVDNSVRFAENTWKDDVEELRRKYGIPIEKKVFLSASLFNKEKGLDGALKAFGEISKRRNDYYYVIAGEGPEQTFMEKVMSAAVLSDTVRIIPFVSGDRKSELFRLADAFILNSTIESFAITLVEAVSYGLYVITTPVGIASYDEDVFNDANCTRVPVGDGAELERAITSFIDGEVELDGVIEDNYNVFKERFDVVPVFERLSSIYSQVLSEA